MSSLLLHNRPDAEAVVDVDDEAQAVPPNLDYHYRTTNEMRLATRIAVQKSVSVTGLPNGDYHTSY